MSLIKKLIAVLTIATVLQAQKLEIPGIPNFTEVGVTTKGSDTTVNLLDRYGTKLSLYLPNYYICLNCGPTVNFDVYIDVGFYWENDFAFVKHHVQSNAGVCRFHDSGICYEQAPCIVSGKIMFWIYRSPTSDLKMYHYDIHYGWYTLPLPYGWSFHKLPISISGCGTVQHTIIKFTRSVGGVPPVLSVTYDHLAFCDDCARRR